MTASGRIVLLTACVYALLVAGMWAPFSVHTGMTGESGFVYTSEIASWSDGFLYHFDPLRIHTKTFYHLPYLIGEVFGIRGSYVPFQIVHAGLWWARGFLLFLLIWHFVRDPLVAFAAGALLLAHSSDAATQWIGQMNQFGFIFWLLLGCYYLTRAFEARPLPAAAFTAAACAAEYMSLWSYESQILLIVTYPLVLLMHPDFAWRRFVVVAAAWWVAPTIYMWLTLTRYSHVGLTYQATVIRNAWDARAIISDWSFNVASSVTFWNWLGATPRFDRRYAVMMAMACSAIFVFGGAGVFRMAAKFRQPQVLSSSHRQWLALGLAGAAALVLSFPVYLLLDSARTLWRTQFLSGIGAALVLASLVALPLSFAAFLKPMIRAVLFLCIIAVIVGFGIRSATAKGALQRVLWERQRLALARIVSVAPSVAPNTIVVLINVPVAEDPFGHDMWLDLAVRLMYPGIPVAGAYFYEDGTPAPGGNLRVAGTRWKWDGTGFPPIVREADVQNTVVVDFRGVSKTRLVSSLPSFVCRPPCTSKLHRAGNVITGPVSPIAVRRYRLDAAF